MTGDFCKSDTNTPADDSLAVRLAEMEAWARRGYDLSAADTIILIGFLRQYMAHAETIDHKVKEMLEKNRSGSVMTETAERKEKFTPGPWVFEHGYRFYRCYSSQEGKSGFYFRVGKNADTNLCSFDDEWMANAALIAAAPDMYAALSCVLALASTPTTKGELVYVDFTEIRSALSKARGES